MNEHIYTNPADITRLLEQLTSQRLPEMAAVIDARSLRCPMPLLKAKIALKSMNDGENLYLVTNDVNAGTDLGHFCTKNGHQMTSWQDNAEFCAIITKNAAQNTQ